MLIGLTALVGVVGLIVAALWTFQRSLVYFPDTAQPPPAADVLDGGQDVQLTTSDELELSAWYVPAPEESAETVLVAPGNAGNRAARAELAEAIADAGYGVLLLDYRGFGGNAGSPTEDGLARDARAARKFLLHQAAVPEQNLIYFGESVGAAVVTELAAEHTPAGVLLRSPFTSLADAGRAAYGVPVGWLLRDEFPVRESVGLVDAPVAVVYSEADTIVPPEQSRAVAQASGDAGHQTHEVTVDGADHNDAELNHGPDVIDALIQLTQD